MGEVFNEDDLVAFGYYLFSKERRENFKNHPAYPDNEQLEKRLSQVHHADVYNWMAQRKNHKNN